MPKTILIVEDEPDARRILGDILTNRGYEVAGAASGQEALEKVDKEKPDLVLVDTKLPDMDGIEVCRQIKNIEGLFTKVIIYTGYIDAVDVTKARLAGADDYEVKTEDFAKLLSAIEKVFLRERERERGKKRVRGKAGE